MPSHPTISGLIGHDDLLVTLARFATARTTPLSLLLVGPAHVGKSLLAMHLAYAIASGEPLGTSAQAHPDIVMLKPDPERGKIGVDAARSVVAAMAVSPLSLRRRAAVIVDADTMTNAAQNVLLKTLEDRSGGATVILTAATEGRLLPTVRSRVIRIPVHRVSHTVMSAAAARLFDDEVDAAVALAVADGAPGRLISLSADAEALAWHRGAGRVAVEVWHMPVAARIAIAATYGIDRAGAREACLLWAAVWRTQLRRLTAQSALVRLGRAIDRAADAAVVLRDTATAPRLVVEDLLIRL